MTTLKIFFIIAVVCGALGCNAPKEEHHHSTHQQHHEEIDRSGKEYTSKYICPMHCEGSGSDTTGTCPVCKMEYVENPKFEKP